MSFLQPDLRQGETVLGEYGATIYSVRGHISSAGSNVRLWLTDQRILLKAGIGGQRALSLASITGTEEEKIGFYTMLRLDFEGGHQEWMTVQNQSQFQSAVEAARVKAPQIPADQLQTPTTPGTFFSKPVIIGGIIFLVLAGACLLTGLGGMVLINLLLFLHH